METRIYQTKNVNKNYKKINRIKAIRQKMYLEMFGLLILLQVGYVGLNFYQLFKEMELGVQPVMAAEVKEPELPMKEWVLQTVKEAGIDPYEAYAIVSCESRWNPEARLINKGGANGIDRGLFQISDKFQPQVSNSCAFDYKCNTLEAIKVYKKRGNWSAWSCSKLIK